MPVKSTVLIVDDEPLGRDTLEALLINEGYELTFAADGAQALAQIAHLRPDLVLLDVMMPDMDGFEVCRRVRGDPELAEIPIILVTALDDRDSRLRGIEAGADDFVTKPFDRLELRTRVRTVTRLDRYRRLLAERARIEWIVEQAQEGYVWLNGHDEILYANPCARVLLDLPDATGGPERPRFAQVAQQHYRCEPEAAWAAWTSAGSETAPDRYLIRPETPTANAFWLRVTVIDTPGGAEDSRIVRLQDVTAEVGGWIEMRGFHEALRHKIRTPFTGILVSLELLAKKGGGLPREAVAELAQVALTSAQRLYDSFSDILAYLKLLSRPEPGERFGLDILEATVRNIATGLENVSMQVDCPESLYHLRLPFTQQTVESILWELLENSRKFHPEQAPAIQVRAFQVDQGRIALHVTDDGIHISPEHLLHIWQPYYQGEKYFTGESKGMGLGLPAVAGLVWNVGGMCRIQNRADGAGVRVELTIPMI